MPTIQPRSPSGQVSRPGSVGRLNINAPAESFGGGVEASALGRIGDALGQVGKKLAVEQAKHDRSDINRFQTQAQNIYNKYAILSKRSTSEEDAIKLRSQADEEVQSLAEAIPRSDTSRLASMEWLEGERGRRDNQWLSIGIGINDRVTQSQDAVTLEELESPAVDVGDLGNKKARLGMFWEQKTDLTEAEIQIGLSKSLRRAELSFAEKLITDIDFENDSWKDQEVKLEAYKKFIKNTNSLKSEDKINADRNISIAEKKTETAFEKQLSNGIVGVILPKNLNESEEIKSERGQAGIIENAKVHIDASKDIKNPEQRARITGMVNSMLRSEFTAFNARRKSDVEEALLSGDTFSLRDMLNSGILSVDEEGVVKKSLANIGKAEVIRVSRETMPTIISNLDPAKMEAGDWIDVYSVINNLSEAEKKVYNEIVKDKHDAYNNRGEDYKEYHNQLGRLLRERYKINGDDISKKKKIGIHGERKSLEGIDRLMLYADDMRRLKEIGDESKDKDKAVFKARAKEYIETTEQGNADELADALFRSMSMPLTGTAASQAIKIIEE